MEVDRKVVKALSSDTRVTILKSLKNRRKMTSELSKELGLSPSTISEHLSKLERAGLVKKKDTGRKWIYYDLTEKGRTLSRPKVPVNVVILLSIGIVLILSNFMIPLYEIQGFADSGRALTETEKTMGEGAGEPVETPELEDHEPSNMSEYKFGTPLESNIINFILLAVGFVMVILGIVIFIKR